MYDFDFQDAVAKVIKRATREFKNMLDPRNEKDLSVKEQRVVRFLKNGSMGGYSMQLAELVSLMLEKDLRPYVWTDNVPYVQHSVVVPLISAENHNYPIGEPVLITNPGARQGMMLSGEFGNNLPCASHGVVRAASEEEVDRMISVLPENVLESNFGMIRALLEEVA